MSAFPAGIYVPFAIAISVWMVIVGALMWMETDLLHRDNDGASQ